MYPQCSFPLGVPIDIAAVPVENIRMAVMLKEQMQMGSLPQRAKHLQIF